MKAYAKYIDNNRSSWSTALTNMVGAIAAGQSGTVADGSGYAANGSMPFPFAGLNGTDNSIGVGPKAYLNYIMFDRDYNPIIDDPSQTGFERLTDAAKEDDASITANPVNGVRKTGGIFVYFTSARRKKAPLRCSLMILRWYIPKGL